MTGFFTSRIGKLFFPVSLTAAAILGSLFLQGFLASQEFLLASLLPLSVFIISLLLALQFKRSCYVLVLVISGLNYYPFYDPDFALNNLQLVILALWSSLSVFVIAFLKDRGILSSHGVYRLLFIVLPLLLFYCIPEHYLDIVSQLLLLDLFTIPPAINQWISVPDALWLIACLAIAHFLLGLVFSKAIHIVFFIIQLLILSLANQVAIDFINPLLLSAGCTCICLAILTESHDMAFRDELTGLPSRRSLNQLLLTLGRQYTIAMMDIDHFKKFNDTHGHDVGDEVLQMVASKIGKVSGGGKAFRYGGEEFTVVFPGKSMDQVEPHLEALRETIDNYQMQVRSQKRPKNKAKNKKQAQKRGKGGSSQALSVSISIGLAERNNVLKTPESVIKTADEALYRAKKAGRNCVSR